MHGDAASGEMATLGHDARSDRKYYCHMTEKDKPPKQSGSTCNFEQKFDEWSICEIYNFETNRLDGMW
jgi:hypothetical protein